MYMNRVATGTVRTKYFYLVKAEDLSRNLAEDSDRVGEFDTGLLNGTRDNEYEQSNRVGEFDRSIIDSK
jgi:hypothetical protein